MKKTIRTLLSFVCICAVITASVSFAFAADSGIYNIEDGILYITDAKNFSKLNSDYDCSEVVINDSDISGSLSITNTAIEKITFCHCEIKSNNVVLPEDLLDITFEESKFSDYSFLGSLTMLDSLTLNYMPGISDLKPFRSAKTITSLIINKTPSLRTLDGIEAFKNLDYVTITDCGIESIEPMKALKKLDTFMITSCDISSLEPVKSAPLTRLYVSNSVNIRNLDIVTGFKKLQIFYAENLEMACSEKLLNFLESNKVETNLTRKSLEYKNEIKSIAKSILKDGMTVQQKVEEIVWYVLEHLEYDYAVEYDLDLSAKYNLNGLKYALSGKGCCRNYTSFITALMYEAGFVSYEVENDGHIWNLIKIKDRFYWLDATWLDDIDRKDMIHSIYYMSDEENFREGHDGYPIPVSYTCAKNDFLTTDFENGGIIEGQNNEKNQKGSSSLEKIKKAEKGASEKKKTEEEKDSETTSAGVSGKTVSVTNTTVSPEAKTESAEVSAQETDNSKTVYYIAAGAGVIIIGAAAAVIIIKKKKSSESTPAESESADKKE